MHVQLRLDSKRLRRWHADLLNEIASRPEFEVSIDMRPARDDWSPLVDLALRADAKLQNFIAAHSAPIRADAVSRYLPRGGERPDVIIDLCGDVRDGAPNLWRVLYSGVMQEAGLLAVLVGGQIPFISLEQNGRRIEAARPGSERGGIYMAAFDDALGATKTVILRALTARGRPAATPYLVNETAPPRLTSPRIALAITKKVARRLARGLYRMAYHTPHWRIGWRRVRGPDLFDLRGQPAGGWNFLPDDTKRFYADPFAILHQGQLFLFVEDFPHETGKGLISCVEFGPDGPIGRPEPVLELDCHLSYPFVFEAEGSIWMIPETSGARTIELYRAEHFPRRWVKAATLVSDCVASDATLVAWRGRWWLFATVRTGEGAFSDALWLWSASDFRGPWRPHDRNPVLIDLASARPAGRMVERNGVLFRPVQDCRGGYGSALGIARVTRLDDDGYEQNVETILQPGPQWPGRRLHSLNSAGDFEFIDGSGLARRW